ncbi:MAG: sugar hydrolase, partial [Bryobacteraceae bacterium]
DALSKGVKLSTVNIMAMDFGSSYDNGGQMEVAALYGAFSTAYELQGLISGLSYKSAAQMTGITPMIGQNDTSSEVFTISNAQQLVSDAHTYGFGFLSFWSATRDYPCPGGATGSPASGSCSGVSSSSQQYSGIFKSF